jgi:anti-sigma B factor antagonist
MQQAGTHIAGGFATRSSVSGTTHTVTVEGEIDIAVAETLSTAIEGALQSGPETVVIDLTAVEFIDVTGVRALMQAHGRAKAEAIRVAIVPAAYHVHRVFPLCGLEQELPFVAVPSTRPRRRSDRSHSRVADGRPRSHGRVRRT